MSALPALSFGALLRHQRLAAGLTQETLAERAGVSPRAIIALEGGERRRPHRQTIQLLAAALQLTGREVEILERAAGYAHSNPKQLEEAADVQEAPFVGRLPELSSIDRFLLNSHQAVLLFAGEPGIGKSRLLDEAARRGRAGGFTVLQGGGHRRSGQEPYAPLLETLARSLTAVAASQLRAALLGCGWLTRLLPELLELASAPLPSGTVPADQERRLIFAAVARYLANVAGPSGTLLVLDDLQWASPDGLDLLAFLLRTGEPIRVVGAYRDTEVGADHPLAATLADLAEHSLAEQVVVGPLGSEETLKLLDVLLPRDGEVPRDEGVRAEIIRRAGGLPFYLVSCAQGVAAGSAIPWNLAQSVRQRVAALQPATQHVLQAVAVAGRMVDRRVLLSMELAPEHEVLATLDEACSARLLMLGGERDYRFTHDVIREVMEADLGSGQRALLHRRVGEALERLPEHGQRAAELAWHFLEADDADRALHYSLRAAGEAATAAAFHQQAALLGQAIGLAGESGQLDLVSELRVQRGRAFFALTAWTEARHELEGALAGLPPGPTEARFHALLYAAEACSWTTDPPAARRYAEDALAFAQELHRNDLIASALSILASSDTADGEVERGIERYRKAFELAGGEEGPTIRSGMERFGFVQYWRGDYHDAEQLLRRALDLAQRTGDATYTARAMGSLGLSLSGQGRYREALEVFAQGQAFAREHGTSNWLARTTAMCGGCYLELGDFDRAEAMADEAREIAQRAGFPLSNVSAGVDLLFNFARRGDAGRTERLIDEVAAGVARSPGPHSWLLSIRFPQAQAEIALARGNRDAALQHANSASALARRYGRKKYQVLAAVTQARALLGLGRGAEAIRDLNNAVELARSIGDPLLLVRAAVELLDIDGDAELLAEAHAAVTRVVSALPDERLARRFQESEPVRRIHLHANPGAFS